MNYVVLGAGGAGVAVLGAGLTVGGVLARKQGLVLAGTVVTALGVLAGVSGLLLIADHNTSLVDAVKTGGLAGGAVVAVYGLWLNDRRRRVAEGRHDIEYRRLANERFSKGIELLGNEADQVRVGAMHSLVRLAESSPGYAQTVLDVLCAYLRRPFHSPRYVNAADPDRVDGTNWLSVAPIEPATPEQVEADRERQVRLTAQRLIHRLLPAVDEPDAPRYDLDLSGATVEYFDLRRRLIGGLTARGAVFYGITRMRGVEFHGSVLLTGSRFHGRTEFPSALFAAGISLYEADLRAEFILTDARMRSMLDLRVRQPDQITATGATVDTGGTLRLPDAWSTTPHPGTPIADLVLPTTITD